MLSEGNSNQNVSAHSPAMMMMMMMMTMMTMMMTMMIDDEHDDDEEGDGGDIVEDKISDGNDSCVDLL